MLETNMFCNLPCLLAPYRNTRQNHFAVKWTADGGRLLVRYPEKQHELLGGILIIRADIPTCQLNWPESDQ